MLAVVTGLEVSSLDGNDFLGLPDTYSQKSIPATKGNIPLQEDVDTWPHLRQVLLPKIDAEIGLLIGTNAPKAMEPWQVIASVDDGPYAVRTRLGWTVNGPLTGRHWPQYNKWADTGFSQPHISYQTG